MLKTLPVVTVVVLLAAYGVAAGLWSDRWITSPALAESQGRLDRLPLAVGPWKGEDQEMSSRQITVGALKAHLLRRYVHATSGEALTVLAVCGKPGTLARVGDIRYRACTERGSRTGSRARN